jgi:ParB family chromosome partitioning protein
MGSARSWRSAETVRRAWLAGLLSRKTLPPGAPQYILTEVAVAHWTLCSSLGQGHQLAAQLLGSTERTPSPTRWLPPATGEPRSSPWP